MGPRTFLVGQMLAALFAGGWRPNMSKDAQVMVDLAIKIADYTEWRMMHPNDAWENYK